MKKPVAKQRPGDFFDWFECVKWIEQKYNCDIRDYAGRYKGNPFHDEKPYQDFWHFIIDGTEIHNGCEYYMEPLELKEYADEDWQKEICQMFYDEFGEDLSFWIEW